MPRRMLASFAVLACLVPLVLGPTSADETSTPQQPIRSNPPRVYALTGAKVVVSAEKTLDEAIIIVRDGRIEAVGAGIAIPADAREISLKGKTVYPGFVEAYSEQSIPSDRLNGTARYWNGQVTPQLSVADGVLEEDASAWRKNGFVARLIAPADGVIRGTSAVFSTGTGSPNATLISRDVAQHILLTVSRRRGGVGGGGFPSSPMGAVALARQAMLDAQWYRDAQQALAADSSLPPVEKNDALAALEPVISGKMPVIISTSDEQFVQRADLYAAEFGLKLIVLGNGREYRRLQEVASIKRPMILPLSFPKAPAVGTPEAADDATLESLLHWDIAPENPGRLEAAGVRFALTTDRLSDRSEFLKALRKAVERGLSPVTALRAITSVPAEMYGLSDQLGSVQAGRLASFVVADGDLFAEKTKIVETWVAGTRYEYSPEPARKASGHYELQLSQSGQFPNRLYMELIDEGGRLRGRISREPIAKSSDSSSRTSRGAAERRREGEKPAGEQPATDKPEGEASGARPATVVVDLKNPRLSDTSLTASFEGKSLGFEGNVRLSLTMTEADSSVKDRPAGIGTVVWTDGSSSSAVAQQVAQPEPPKPEPPQAENKDAAASTTTPPTDGAAPVTPVPPTPAPSSAEPQTAQAGSATPAPTASAENTDKKPEEQKKSAKASYDVNYPLGAFGRSSIPETAKLTAFVHATIWTCGPQSVLEDATLLIDNGRIVAVGKDVKIPDGTHVIDVRGMHITPGIIDCHSHMATDGGVNEGSQAITCEVRVSDFVDANDITIYRQLAGGVTAANILHGSANPIGGQNQVIKLRWGQTGEEMKFREAPAGVKFALGENVKQSNRTDGGGRYPATRMGVEQLYRDAFEAARDYGRRMETWKTSHRGLPPRRDLELEALWEILQGQRWIHCHSYRQDEILAFLRVLEEYQVKVGTLQHILEGYKIADELAKHGAMASAFSDWWAYKFEVYDAIPYAGSIMHNQGVVVSFNSDDGELARHLNQEAAKAIKYGGVPPEEALKFVTLNPAKQLRIDHVTGSLEAGKHADFVVWSGDPLSNFSRCEQTWIDGRRYFQRDEDEQLRKLAQEKRNTLIQKILNSGEEMRQPGERDRNPSELWPRFDEYCSHFKHQAAQQLQLQRQQAEQNE
jgi:imidazolonepropionase-like amidohydrolase